MELRSTHSRYGLVPIVMHWLAAIAIFGLFFLGDYMVDLGYYDPWYRSAPHLHKSIGVLLFLLMVVRLGWHWLGLTPVPLASHRPWEVRLAHLAHIVLYLLIFVVMVSGYLISTADGSAVAVFSWFEVPSVTGQVKQLEDIAGTVHRWCAWSLVGLAVLHALAAIKHHVIDRDETLRRMIGLSAR